VENLEGLARQIVDATAEIFSSMVMMEVASDAVILSELGSLQASITGMVGLAGTHKGVLAIHIPNQLALAITSSFLGMEVESVNEDVQDAVGELANMLGGNVKAVLSERGRDISLSLPSTISGEQYFFQALNDVDTLILPFTAPGGVFHVELQLEK